MEFSISTELLTLGAALVISLIGVLFNYYKLKNDQTTWEQEQKISIEKKVLFENIKIRRKLYPKLFNLLGYIKDIEYPKQVINNEKLASIADEILKELYNEAGLSMEYKTRSLILKTYQISYKYIDVDDNVKKQQLVDSYYNARRAIREDLGFDDSKDTVKKVDLVDLSNKKNKEHLYMVNKEKIWVVKNKLAKSPRPGYPNKDIKEATITESTEFWKTIGIKSIICLLSKYEISGISGYYGNIGGKLIEFYKEKGFEVLHIDVKDFQTPALSKDNEEELKKGYKKLKIPILVHCGAGIDRTEFAIKKIKDWEKWS